MLLFPWASLMTQRVKHLPAMQETWVWSLGWEDSLEKGKATHSSILAWRIPWTEEPGGLWSMGSQRVGHDWATNTHTTYQVLPTTLFCETDKKQSNKPIYHTIAINIRKVTWVDGGNRICLTTRRSKMLRKNYLSPGNWGVNWDGKWELKFWRTDKSNFLFWPKQAI